MQDNHSVVAHQFNDALQQQETLIGGMWVFLATEIMFFGGLFLGYTIFRTAHPAAFALGSHLTNLALGGINTAVLITSSLTMALAVHYSESGARGRVLLFLFLTLVLGAAFLGIKGVEYYHKFVDHHVPGPGFVAEGPDANGVELFMFFYFAMTGLHALHMIIGMGLILVLMALEWRNVETPMRRARVEMFGLYWHFVDIVWIFLFPLLYLIGRSG